LRSASPISLKFLFLTAAMGVLLIPALSESPEYGDVAELLDKSVSSSEFTVETRSRVPIDRPPRLEMTSGRSESVVIPDIPKTKQASNVFVWGTIQTESGAVTHFDRIMLYSLSLDKGYEAFSNPNGYFYIEEMTPAPDYGLWVIPAGMYQQQHREMVSISSDQREFSIVLRELPVGTLSGVIVNTDGIAVPEFGIKIRSLEKATKSMWSASFITDRFGSFQVENVPLGVLEFSSTFGHALRITGHKFVGDPKFPLILVVDQGTNAISGQVYDQFNNPVGGANVVLNWENTDGQVRSVVTRQKTTNTSGEFSMKGMGSGEHELTISIAGSTHRQIIDISGYNTDLLIHLSH
jgi:hypothetical protein